MEFKITLDQQQVMIVGQALMELPAKISMPLINNIQRQVDEQVNNQSKEKECPQETL